MAITTTLNSILEFIGYGLPPVGAIEMYAGTTAPSGWLKCDGSAVSRTAYAKLFAAIGTTYGAGDGTTTFNLPDLGGNVAVGADNTYTLGSTGGEATHKLVASEMPKHSHGTGSASYPYFAEVSVVDIQENVASALTGSGYAFPRTASSGKWLGTANTEQVGGGSAHENMQPYIVLNYIIRAT